MGFNNKNKILIVPEKVREMFCTFFETEDDITQKINTLLKELGIERAETIVFKDINEEDKMFSICDSLYTYYITINSSVIYNPCIVVENDDSKKIFEYIISESKFLLIFYESKKPNIKNFYHLVSNEGLYLEITLNNNLHIIINFKDNDNLVDDCYNIKNQSLLFDKLCNIDESSTFFDIFKIIYDTSLIYYNLYYFSLELKMIHDRKNCENIANLEVLDNKLVEIDTSISEYNKILEMLSKSNISNSKIKNFNIFKKKTNV